MLPAACHKQRSRESAAAEVFLFIFICSAGPVRIKLMRHCQTTGSVQPRIKSMYDVGADNLQLRLDEDPDNLRSAAGCLPGWLVVPPAHLPTCSPAHLPTCPPAHALALPPVPTPRPCNTARLGQVNPEVLHDLACAVDQHLVFFPLAGS